MYGVNKQIIRCFYLLTFVSLMVSLFPLPASANGLDAILIPTLTKASDDFWSRVPLDSGPKFPFAETVFPGQEFTLLLFIRGYGTDKENNVHITYDLQVYDPEGKPTDDTVKDLVAYRGPLGRPNTLLFPEQYIKLVFTDKYPLGTYTVKVKLHDRMGDVFATKEVSVELVPFATGEAFSSGEEVSKWMMNYYGRPDPARVIPAMNQVIKVDREWLTEKAYLLVFFQKVVEDNDYFLKSIAGKFAHFSTDEKKRLLLMAALTESTVLDPFIKDRDLKEFHKFAKTIRLPDTTGAIYSADQLDSLWAKFMATGKYDPIRKLVSSLKLSKYMGTLDKIKAGELDKNNKEVITHAYYEAAWQSALWSLTSNCVQIPQVYKYCLFMYENENLDDDIKRQLYLILQRAQKQLKEGQE